MIMMIGVAGEGRGILLPDPSAALLLRSAVLDIEAELISIFYSRAILIRGPRLIGEGAFSSK